MKRLIIAACVGFWGLAGLAVAQPLPGTNGPDDPAPLPEAPAPVKSVATPPWNNGGGVTPPPTYTPPAYIPPSALPASQATPPAGSPGEAQASPETRAHEYHVMQAQSAEESVHRAAVARAEQRTRRIESQRWFGISNKRPSASVDPYDGDYAAYWASNYPFYPLRWVGSGEPWGFVESQP